MKDTQDVNVIVCDNVGNSVMAIKLAFAGSKFVNRLKPLLAQGFSRVAIVVVLLQILALFGHVDDPWWWLYLQ